MVRSFGISTNDKSQVHLLAERLDKELIKLQQNGWKIISVFNTPCERYDRGYFNSVLFTIIAEHE